MNSPPALEGLAVNRWAMLGLPQASQAKKARAPYRRTIALSTSCKGPWPGNATEAVLASRVETKPGKYRQVQQFKLLHVVQALLQCQTETKQESMNPTHTHSTAPPPLPKRVLNTQPQQCKDLLYYSAVQLSGQPYKAQGRGRT